MHKHHLLYISIGDNYGMCSMLSFPAVTVVWMQGLQCLEEAVDVSEAHLYNCQSLLDVTEVSCVDHRPWSCHLTILLCYTGMANSVAPSPQDFICVCVFVCACVRACVRVCVCMCFCVSTSRRTSSYVIM